MTDIIMIPLTKLGESEDNVRRSNRKDGIAELAASVKAIGLLQSIVVKDAGNGKFGVIAGGRRLRALRLLAKAGDIEKNAPIPCRVISGDDNATDLSLAENISRRDLLPWEELGAYKQHIDSGEGPETIAARFGVSPQHVVRRLKLARVSPRLLEALKREEATLDQLAALALTDDHARQDAAFFDAPDWARTPERLRAQITQAHVPDTDKLARFVGIDGYKAEGGGVTSDLFAEENGDTTLWLTDRDLLTRLAEDKLQPIAAQARGEGWAWIEIAIDEISWQRFPMRVRDERRTLSKKEQTRLEHLYAKLDEAEDTAEIEQIEAEIDALAPTIWPAEEVTLAGAVVTLTRDGLPKVERGLVRNEDVKALKALRRKAQRTDAPQGEDAEDGHTGVPPPAMRFSAKLVEELEAHKTLALRVELIERPDAALRILVFTLAERFVGGFSASPLGLRVEEEDVARSITRSESKAPQAYETVAASWRDRLPAGREDLWRFITEAEQQTLLNLLAVLIAPGLDLRMDARTSGHDAQTRICDLFIEAVGLDMSRWWSASADSYFTHVKREMILDAIREHKPGLVLPNLEKTSKAELISRTKRIFKGSAWLPEPLRTHSVSVQSPTEGIAAE
jgi:ParB family chromosome partitioning protein